MKNSTKLTILMVILSFGFMMKTVVLADWWERGDRPVLPRQEFEIPTQPPVDPTSPPPTQIPDGKVSPPPQGGPEVTPTPDPGNGGDNGDEDDDPCAEGKSYTGEYCGWSPGVGDPGNGGGGEAAQSYGPQVQGLSYTSGEDAGLSDIMLLAGLLCLLMYAKSKFAPNVKLSGQGKRRSR